MAESAKFEVHIISGDQQVKRFRSKPALLRWSEDELVRWQRFMNLILKAASEPENNISDTKNIMPHFTNIIRDTQLQKISDFTRDLNMAEGGERDITNAANRFSAQRCFSSFSERGSYLLRVVENDALKAIFLFGYWHPECNFQEIFPYQNNLKKSANIKTLRVAMNEAHIEAYFFDNNTFEQSEIERKAYIELREEMNTQVLDFEERFEAQTNKVNKFIEGVEKKHQQTDSDIAQKIESKEKIANELIDKQKKILIDHKNNFETDLKNLTEKYDLGFSMESPVKYWSNQFKIHKRNAGNWGIVFGTVLAIVALLSFCSLISFIEFLEIHPTLLKAPYLVIFLISFPAFLAIWMLRIISRNLLSSINHMHEAKHRELASSDDKILMLNALFQPLKSQADDGAPPNWYALLMEKAGKST